MSAVLLIGSSILASVLLTLITSASKQPSALSILEFESRWGLGALVAICVSWIGGALAVALFAGKVSTPRGRGTLFTAGALSLPTVFLTATVAIGQTSLEIFLICLVVLAAYFFALRGLLSRSIRRSRSTT